MASKIKGINIKIGADTTGLNTALKGIESTARKSKTELREIEKSLKNNSDSAVLWKQKQELLTNALESSTKKLQLLEEVQEQVNRQFQNNEISAETYRAFQREIENTRSETQRLQSQLEETTRTIGNLGSESDSSADDMADLGNETDNAANSAENAANGGFTVLKGALANLVSEGISKAAGALKDFTEDVVVTGADFESAMSNVKAISGATDEEFEKLTEKAEEMGATTKFTAKESAEAFNYMAMAGWKTEDMLGGIEGIMNLAAASGEDLATTSDIVTDALTAFGMTAEESGHFANLLAVASANANTNVSLMGETFKYVAPVAGALGYSAEDVAESIGLMANAGIKASQAGTSLRAAMTRLSTNAGATKNSLGALDILVDKLGVKFYDAEGKARDFGDVIDETREAWKGLDDETATTYAKKIAGTNAISGWLALMNAAPADIEKLSSAIENCDGAAQDMAKTMLDNLSGDMTIAQSAIDGMKISLSERLNPALRNAVQYFTSKVPDIQKKLEKTFDTMSNIVDFSMKNVPKAIDVLKDVTPVIVGIGTAVGALKLASLANTVLPAIPALIGAIVSPVGLAAGAVAALGGAIYYFNTEHEKAKTGLDELIETHEKEYQAALDSKSAIDELNSAFDKNSAQVQAETDRTKELWKELDTLADQYGNVDEKNHARAEYILNELNSALGTEYTMTGNQIDNYKALADEIDNVIAKKQAESLLDSYLAMNSDMVSQRENARQNYEKYDLEYRAAKEERETAEKRLERYFKNMLGFTDEQFEKVDLSYYANKGEDKQGKELANAVLIARENESNALVNKRQWSQNYRETTEYLDRLSAAQEAYYSENYEAVKDILYSEQDLYKSILDGTVTDMEERQKAFEESLQTSISDFKLTLKTNSPEAVKDAAKSVNETMKLALLTDNNIAEVWGKNFKDGFQQLLDEGFDVSALLEWAEEGSIPPSEIFGENFMDYVQSQLDEGYDIMKLLRWAKDSGEDIAGEYTNVYTKYVQKKIDEGYDITQLQRWGSKAGLDVAALFNREYSGKIQSAIDSGYDIGGLLSWAESSGIDVGTLFGENFQSYVDNYLRATESDFWTFIDGVRQQVSEMFSDSPIIQTMFQNSSFSRSIPMMADGGFLHQGQAVVAEAGPELLQIMNGGVKVTPLSGNAKNTTLSDTTKAVNVYQTFNVNASVSSDYDVRKLSQELGQLSKQTAYGKGK